MGRCVNKGVAMGQKAALEPAQIEQIDGLLSGHLRNRALFRTGLYTALRSVDLVSLRARDVVDGAGKVRERFAVIVRKVSDFSPDKRKVKSQTVQIDARTRDALQALIDRHGLSGDAKLFDVTTGQYRRLIKSWCKGIGLDPTLYAGHSTRRTMPSLVYRKTKDIEACRRLLGHTNIMHTCGYLSVTHDMALRAGIDALNT